jgi:dTDP-glucose 4,6-dehydratase
MATSNLLVIGASSFTGKHFCEYARAKGTDIDEVSLRNLRAVAGILQRDYEWIVNFAALNVVAPSWQYPSDYLFTNTYALTSIVDMLKERKALKRFVQISTPEVYGSTAGWVKEDAPYNPSTPYAVSRAAAEMMLKAYHRQYGFPVVFTRACNVYGPGQQLYRLIPKLIASIKRGLTFPLEGGGASSRAFVHVRDACDAIWRVMMEGENGSAYHIAPREIRTIAEIANYICSKLHAKPSTVIENVPERPGKDASYMLDSGRIRLLSWEDTVSMDMGIEEVIAWMNGDWTNLEQLPLEYTHRP